MLICWFHRDWEHIQANIASDKRTSHIGSLGSHMSSQKHWNFSFQSWPLKDCKREWKCKYDRRSYVKKPPSLNAVFTFSTFKVRNQVLFVASWLKLNFQQKPASLSARHYNQSGSRLPGKSTAPQFPLNCKCHAVLTIGNEKVALLLKIKQPRREGLN